MIYICGMLVTIAGLQSSEPITLEGILIKDLGNRLVLDMSKSAYLTEVDYPSTYTKVVVDKESCEKLK